MSSYLSDSAALEFDPSGGSNNNQGNYEYTLPHAKAIDLIGEEFVPKARTASGQSVVLEGIPMSTVSSSTLGHNVVFVNTSTGTFTSNSHGVPIQVQQIIQQAQNQVMTHDLIFGLFSVRASSPPQFAAQSMKNTFPRCEI